MALRSSLQVLVTALVELVVSITHGLWLATTKHYLEIHRFKAVVVVSVNDTGRAGNAFPRPQALDDLVSALIFHKDVEMPLQHKETFFHFMRMRSVTLPRGHEHNGKREVSGRNYRCIVVLSRTAGTDKAMLRTFVSFKFRVLKSRPIRPSIGETRDISIHDLLQ